MVFAPAFSSPSARRRFTIFGDAQLRVVTLTTSFTVPLTEILTSRGSVPCVEHMHGTCSMCSPAADASDSMNTTVLSS